MSRPTRYFEVTYDVIPTEDAGRMYPVTETECVQADEACTATHSSAWLDNLLVSVDDKVYDKTVKSAYRYVDSEAVVVKVWCPRSWAGSDMFGKYCMHTGIVIPKIKLKYAFLKFTVRTIGSELDLNPAMDIEANGSVIIYFHTFEAIAYGPDNDALFELIIEPIFPMTLHGISKLATDREARRLFAEMPDFFLP